MLIKYFYDDYLAQASYLVGCAGSGTALVIDPARDIQPYLDMAQKHGLRIDYVTETHIHADFVSGTRELAHATGATMLLSGEGGMDWSYQFPAGDKFHLLYDQEVFYIGGVKFQVLHTPGHTPEHLSFMVTDTNATEPLGIFTGDFLFVGDVGRPDLLEEAAGIFGTREPGARQQFANIQTFKALPDYLQIFPGHGAGSACGKALGAMPSSTLGYEKRFNPAFHITEDAAFVDWLLAGQPEAPRYFGRMKQVNKVGPALLADLAVMEELSTLATLPEGALVIDTRSGAEFAKQHWHGTINVPISASGFNTYVGWYVDYHQPTYVIAYAEQLPKVMSALRAIGVDNIPAYLLAEKAKFESAEVIKQQSPQEIFAAGMKIMDVRAYSEYDAEHIPGVWHLHMGKVPQHLNEIPRDLPIAVQCGSGVRSQVVVSLLEANGFTNIINMEGGIAAWKQAKLPVEQA